MNPTKIRKLDGVQCGTGCAHTGPSWWAQSLQGHSTRSEPKKGFAEEVRGQEDGVGRWGTLRNLK